MANLKVNFCGVEFLNPVVLASCFWSITNQDWQQAVENGVGGITTKSIWLDPRDGHPDPIMVGTEHYFINAVGGRDGGMEAARRELPAFLADQKVPLIASVLAKSVEDFALTAQKVAELNPDLVEINLSCPNIEDEFGKPLACSVLKVSEVVRLVKQVVNKPVVIKMSPNVENPVAIALAAEEAGADALCCFNTFGPGLIMDVETRSPILSNKVGGVSGAAIKPLVLKMVNDIYQAVKIPIIGTGGVMSGKDAIEMMMCGASLVGVASLVHYEGYAGFAKVVDEMNEWLDSHGINDVSEIIGTLKR